MDRLTRKRLYRGVQGVITATFVLDLIAIWYLDYIFVHDRPSRPGGRFTFEYPSHGSSTFITTGDHQLFILAWVVPFVLLSISGLLYQFHRLDWRRTAKQKAPL